MNEKHDVAFYIKGNYMFFGQFLSATVAQWIRHRPPMPIGCKAFSSQCESEPGIAGSSPAGGSFFDFVKIVGIVSKQNWLFIQDSV